MTDSNSLRETTTIRTAELADIPEIWTMQQALATYCHATETYAVTDTHLTNLLQHEQNRAEIFVASTNIDQRELLTGFVIAYIMPLGWQGGPSVYVEDVFVKEAYRSGSGIGGKLLARCGALALSLVDGDASRASLRLDTEVADNDATNAAYDALGFTKSSFNRRLKGIALLDLVAKRS